jgi:serine protease Do
MKANRYLPLVLVLAVALCLGQLAWATPAKDQPLTQQTFIDVAKQLLPSVVSIKVQRQAETTKMFTIKPGEGQKQFQGRPEDLPEELKKRFDFEWPFPFFQFQMPEFQIEPTVSGSGLIVSSDGYIVTNVHVIDDAKDKGIEVVLNDERKFSGDKVKVIGADKLTDIAVLKIDATDLQAAKWGDSDNAQIGEWVLALGNPFELRGSVTQGIVSAKHRVIGKSAIEDLFQTTAIINPGNSGGPLVNLDGEVIGMNVAIASNVEAWQGIGFAIPSNTAKRVSNALIKEGKVSRGYLGIRMAQIDDRIAQYYDLKNREGVLVANVEAGSPAEKAGIKRYDIITGVNGKKIKDARDMLNEIATKPASSSVSLTFEREVNGKLQEQTVEAVLAERPPENELTTKPQAEIQQEGYNTLGLSLEEIAGTEKGKPEGIQVKEVRPGSPADNAGLRAGDKIVEINRQPVKSVREFNEALKKAPTGKPHLVTFERDGVLQITTISPEKSNKE